LLELQDAETKGDIVRNCQSVKNGGT
jgi:hypothetical protein